MYKWVVAIVLLCIVPSLSGCGNGYGCGASVDLAIVVTVLDAQTKAPAAEGAVATIRDGDYLETLQIYTSTTDEPSVPLSLAGAYERPGTYTVRVEKAGYQPWERTGVRVRQDACQLNGGRLEASLQRIE